MNILSLRALGQATQPVTLVLYPYPLFDLLVIIALAVAAFSAYALIARRLETSLIAREIRSAVRWLQWRSGPALVLIAFLASLFAYLGALQLGNRRLDAIYGASKILTLHPPQEGTTTNWSLDLARLLVILFLVGGAFELFNTAFSRVLLLRFGIFGTRHRHSVVCGAGQVGTQLVRDIITGTSRGGPRPVVVIEINPNCKYLDECRRLGASVIVGDASDPAYLQLAKIKHAKEIFIVAGNDGINFAILAQVAKLRAPATDPQPRPQQKPQSELKLNCYVHVLESHLRDALASHPYILSQMKGLKITGFNVFRNTARWFMKDQFSSLLREEFHSSDNAIGPCTYNSFIIFGFERMGQELALAIGRMAHTHDRTRPRIAVFATDMAKKRAAFTARYPRFGPESVPDMAAALQGDPTLVSDWHDRRFRPAEPYWCRDNAGIECATVASFRELPADINDSQYWLELSRIIRAADTRTMIIVCFDDEVKNLEFAIRIQQKLNAAPLDILSATEIDQIPQDCLETVSEPSIKNVNIYVWLRGREGVNQLLQRRASETPVANEIEAFGGAHNVCRYDDIVHDDDVQARRFHEQYLETGQYENLQRIEEAAYNLLKEDANSGDAPFIAKFKKKLLPPGWDEMGPGDIQESNLAQVDAIRVKIAGLGYRVVSLEEFVEIKTRPSTKIAMRFGFPEDDLILIAMAEHNRWTAERLIAGYRYGRRSNKLRMRKSICPWEQLTTEDKNHDYKMTYNIPSNAFFSNTVIVRLTPAHYRPTDAQGQRLNLLEIVRIPKHKWNDCEDAQRLDRRFEIISQTQ